ncbi:transketolase C-terminal domain-containing protein [Microbacterium sp. Bi121]|uniref:transketolase family protein n=1 Tax=Microbacterium sp. Bi121 TaxID=2822348 RepID=UPI001DFE481A|nr:transketolase C-terminal domain-containing protein [Microbacterium sp. Bi121]CAH0123199.1 1-deoxy-D-xylulose-5-phosphate synthase [Microbacterium sp. Bi121]
MSDYALNPDLYSDDVVREPIRAGFGRGLRDAGARDERIVALCADLTESTQMSLFQEEFPDRFIEVGVAEQNLVTVAAGMARAGKIPFTSSYAAFSPGRNWEQIKTTAALNDQPVKVVGSHAGLNVGPDGATHQMLEDISLMRVMPNMVVIAPGDSVEAEKATIAIAANGKPSYLRLARDKTPVFSTEDSPFEIGRAYVLRQGTDVTLAGTGTQTYELLVAAKILAEEGVDAEVLHVPTIKPLDADTILASVRKTGRIVTAEEAQRAGGLGGAVAELLGERLPRPIVRLGVDDRYGESGTPAEVLDAYRLTGRHLADSVRSFLGREFD